MNAQDRRRRIMPRRQDDVGLELLAALVRGAPVAIYSESFAGRILTWNAAAERLFGYAAHEAVGQPASMLVPPERANEARCIRERAAQGRSVAGLETVRLHKDGNALHLSLDAAAARADADEAAFLVIIARPLAAQRESEERFRGLAEAIPSIVWEADAHGRALYKNRVWFEYTGQDTGRDSDADWLQFYHPDERALVQAVQQSAGEAPAEPFEIEARLRRHDGVYRWFHIQGAPIRDSSGRVARWAGTCTDIDDQKRAAQALEEADRHKNEFLAMLAHELRNPLASIRNAGEIVKLSAGENQRLRYAIEVIGRQTERLGRLIADLLDLSNIARGKLALQREPCDLLSVIREAIEMNRGAIERKDQQLELRLTEPRLVLLGDASRLVQLVSNLIDNAMKYTPPRGRIEVAARREGDRAVLDVRDTGEGIPPELLPRVFDLFVQGQRRAGRAEAGLGIGLALVKEIAALHDGSVAARSRGAARGSEFTVTLPLLDDDGAGGAPEPGANRTASTPVRRVLIVDDNRDYADSLAMLLQHLGHRTLTLYGAAEALAQAVAFVPDVTLLDIGLPGMDGVELCRRLRAEPRLAHTVHVAISGFGQEADRARTDEAGFAYHLLKPVRLSDLLPIIENVAAPGRSA